MLGRRALYTSRQTGKWLSVSMVWAHGLHELRRDKDRDRECMRSAFWLWGSCSPSPGLSSADAGLLTSLRWLPGRTSCAACKCVSHVTDCSSIVVSVSTNLILTHSIFLSVCLSLSLSPSLNFPLGLMQQLLPLAQVGGNIGSILGGTHTVLLPQERHERIVPCTNHSTRG
jgi:hypothetical protein